MIGAALLLGLLLGLSLFALAGARRTQSAYPRFLRDADASTMAIDYGRYDATTDAAIAAFPEVERSTSYVAFTTGPMVDGRPDFDQDFEALGTFDGRFFSMDRFAPTEGRRSDPAQVGEIVVNETAADLYGYHVGQRMELATYSDEQVNGDGFFEDPPPPKLRTPVRIVGIGAFTDEVVQDDTNRLPLVLLTPAFSRLAAPYATYVWQGLALRGGDGDVPAVQHRFMQLMGPDAPQFFRVSSVDTQHVQQAVKPLSMALALFGVIAGVAAVVLVWQELDRQQRAMRRQREIMRAIGATPRQLVGWAMAQPVLVVVVGTTIAVVGALLCSPLMALGSTRRVEAAPGIDADWTVLGLGAAVVALVLIAGAAASAVRALPHRRSRRGRAGRSRVVDAAFRSGMPPTAVAGLRFAFEPTDGSTGVSLRSVRAAAVVAVTTIVATLVFGSSFRNLLDTPSLYGWNWDAAVLDSSGYGSMDLERSGAALDHDPDVERWSGGYFGADLVDGRSLPILGMDPSSTVTPPILSGRMLEGDDEIVLGSETARQLQVGLGDHVRLGRGGDRVRVVGTATLPAIGVVHGAHTSLGVGAIVAPARVPGVDRPLAGSGGPPDEQISRTGPPVLFVRFVPGVDVGAARRRLATTLSDVGEYPGSPQVLSAQRPAEVVNSTDVGTAPARLATALGLGAVVSLAVALGGSVARRRRELELLHALGCTRRQLGSTVVWQATATIAVGLLLGIPAGIVLGRQLWLAFADQLDVVSEVVVPAAFIAVVVGIAVVAANLVAVVPATIARRHRGRFAPPEQAT